jgi:PAS domain-containing protein
MSRTCAWCKAELPTENGDSVHVITRCFCPACLEYFSSPRSPKSLQQYLDEIKVPVLVMDDDVRVLGFNKSACALLGRRPEGCVGRYGGDVLECAYARLPGGCGNTEHCKACAIRITVTTTHATGDSKTNVPAYQDVVTAAGTREVRLLISTEKVGSFVLLRIDEVRPNL